MVKQKQMETLAHGESQAFTFKAIRGSRGCEDIS